MYITTVAQLEPLMAPLGENHIGRGVEECADYTWLDEELLKVGSLQHGQVDWAGAEARAVRLLSQQGKDLRVLGHLLHCLQQGGDAVRFALSLRLLAGSLGTWWDDAYPYAGSRGAKLRPRLFKQFIQRAVKHASALDFDSAEEERQACQEALGILRKAAIVSQLPETALAELAQQLQRSAHRAPSGNDVTPPVPRPTTATTPPLAEQPAANSALKMPELHLEAGNERANRQTLLKMADFLNEQSPGEALGYCLRRYAIWGAIQALPAARDDGRTTLVPVAAERIADYREALARGGDVALWRRIENSLAVSPYWLEGHCLSAQLAEELGHRCCASAIRDQAKRFVARLPGLGSLSFNDATPFIDSVTQQWLHSAPDMSEGGGVSNAAEPWQIALAEARERLAEEGLEAALRLLDQGLAAAQSPRDGTYWRLVSADLLAETGLENLAQQHYRALYQRVVELELEEWEPALIVRLRASLRE